MPQYVYACPSCGDRIMRWCTVRIFTDDPQMQCTECDSAMDVVIHAPILVKAAADVCYDSPIDGSHITSWQKRQEDLKRNGCTPYDPEMKTDYHARIKASEAALDQTIESSVEEAIEKMPTAKRGKLMSEMTQQGMSADVIRTVPNA